MKITKLPDLSEKSMSTGSLMFIITCSAFLILDSIIVRFYSSIPREPPGIVTMLLFDSICAILFVSSYIFLRVLGHTSFRQDTKTATFTRILFLILLSVQVVICAIVSVVATMTATLGAYELELISALTYLSFLPAMGYLLFLSYLFLRWFKHVRNYSVLLYGVGFALMILNLAISLIYLNLQISQYIAYFDATVEVTSVRVAMFRDPSPTASMLLLGTIYDYAAIPIFLLIWLPTAIQLRSYSVSMGNAKYWAIVLIPLLYYCFPLVADEMGLFNELRLEYGSEFNSAYILLFGPYKQVGGLLFGLVLWATSLKVTRKALRNTLQLSGTGLILLFGSTVMHGATYITSPPFGFITITFAGLASAMVLFGLYSSALLMSRDARLRTEIKKLLMDDASLLQGMGSAQHEVQVKQLVALNAKVQQMARDTGIEEPLDELAVKDYLDSVMKEIHRDRK